MMVHQGLPDAIPMFISLLREFYWLLMSNDVSVAVRNCQSRCNARGTITSSKKQLLRFARNSPF